MGSGGGGGGGGGGGAGEKLGVERRQIQNNVQYRLVVKIY